MTLCSPAVEATKTWVRWYGDELGFNHVEEAIGSVLAQTWKDCRGRQRKGPRNYTADERAKVPRHDLCRAPASRAAPHRRDDVDKEGRERARRDRYNAKRRAVRAKRRIERATEKERTAKSGVNRCIPSSRRVVLDSDSLEIRARIPEHGCHGCHGCGGCGWWWWGGCGCGGCGGRVGIWFRWGY